MRVNKDKVFNTTAHAIRELSRLDDWPDEKDSIPDRSNDLSLRLADTHNVLSSEYRE
jgi:hypothetical protein